MACPCGSWPRAESTGSTSVGAYGACGPFAAFRACPSRTMAPISAQASADRTPSASCRSVARGDGGRSRTRSSRALPCRCGPSDSPRTPDRRPGRSADSCRACERSTGSRPSSPARSPARRSAPPPDNRLDAPAEVADVLSPAVPVDEHGIARPRPLAARLVVAELLAERQWDFHRQRQRSRWGPLSRRSSRAVHRTAR
jgi:hypothetical protein